MYFMQAAGEPLRLKFTKGPYGPYAQNLRHVVNAIEGHLVSGYADGEDAPDSQLKLIPGALEDARVFLESRADTRARFGRVSDLVDGFESSFGLELLATVHWIAGAQLVRDLDEVARCTHAWNARKKQFSRRQIELAFNVLSEKGWLTSAGHPRSLQ